MSEVTFGSAHKDNPNPFEANAGHNEDPTQYSATEGHLYDPETLKKASAALTNAAEVWETWADESNGADDAKVVRITAAYAIGAGALMATSFRPWESYTQVADVAKHFIDSATASPESGTIAGLTPNLLEQGLSAVELKALELYLAAASWTVEGNTLDKLPPVLRDFAMQATGFWLAIA